MYTITYIIPATRTLHTICTPNRATAWSTLWALAQVGTIRVRMWRGGELIG